MLRSRLFLGLLPLLLAVVGTGAYAIYACHRLAGPLQGELVAGYRAALASESMRTSATLMSGDLTLEDADPVAIRQRLEGQRGAFTRELMGQAASSAGTPREGLVERLYGAFQKFSALCDQAAAGGGSLADFGARESALYEVYGALDALVASDSARAREAAARAGRLASTAIGVLAATIAAAAVLCVAVAWALAASLLRPIKALTASAVAVGEGNLDAGVPELSGDELGVLARSFNTMAAKLRDYRNASDEKVLRTQRTMEATLTSAPEPLFVVSREGDFEVRNPAADELSKQPEFARGLPEALALPLARVLETNEHYLPADYSNVVTFRVGRQDRHFLPRILSIGDRLTQFRGAAVILQDVTRFRLLDDAKTNLVGTVSHELKTPLTSLRMAVYLLLEGSLGPVSAGQKEMLETARDDADRLLMILDSLLDLARLEAGASAMELREVDAEALLRDAADGVRALAGGAGLRLRLSGAPGAGRVRVDAARIRHVFGNFLSNAAKFSDREGAIEIGAEREPGGFVRFHVRNRGEAIPAEALPRLFERFYRVPGQARPGVGLGLTIAREIVVAHGGTVGCQSAAGITEFYFLLPAA
ncbi:MAG TPA: ATP-binding protein [Opitutaceae bacterium]|jgi:signal transduction histidine kinase